MRWKFNDNLQFPLRLQFEFYLLFFKKPIDRDEFIRPFLDHISFLPHLRLYTTFQSCESYMLFPVHHLFREFTFKVNILLFAINVNDIDLPEG